MSKSERTILANHVQQNLARGGRLTITSEALCFRPTSIEQALGKVLSIVGMAETEDMDILLKDVASVGKTERELSRKGIFAGSTRERLRVVRKDGTEEVFVVNNLDKVIAYISELLPQDTR